MINLSETRGRAKDVRSNTRARLRELRAARLAKRKSSPSGSDISHSARSDDYHIAIGSRAAGTSQDDAPRNGPIEGLNEDGVPKDFDDTLGSAAPATSASDGSTDGESDPVNPEDLAQSEPAISAPASDENGDSDVTIPPSDDVGDCAESRAAAGAELSSTPSEPQPHGAETPQSIVDPSQSIESEKTSPSFEACASETLEPQRGAPDKSGEHNSEDAGEHTQSEPPKPGEVPTQSDLKKLPGAGEGLVWLLAKADIHSLRDLAGADAEKLEKDLGLVGEILDLEYWITFAKGNADD